MYTLFEDLLKGIIVFPFSIQITIDFFPGAYIYRYCVLRMTVPMVIEKS